MRGADAVIYQTKKEEKVLVHKACWIKLRKQAGLPPLFEGCKAEAQ